MQSLPKWTVLFCSCQPQCLKIEKIIIIQFFPMLVFAHCVSIVGKPRQKGVFLVSPMGLVRLCSPICRLLISAWTEI